MNQPLAGSGYEKRMKYLSKTDGLINTFHGLNTSTEQSAVLRHSITGEVGASQVNQQLRG